MCQRLLHYKQLLLLYDQQGMRLLSATCSTCSGINLCKARMVVSMRTVLHQLPAHAGAAVLSPPL